MTATAQPAYTRILLKLSGEALMGDDAFGINRSVIERMVSDIAEVIGGAVALYLLFDIPLLWGGIITGGVSLTLLLVQSRGGARP